MGGIDLLVGILRLEMIHGKCYADHIMELPKGSGGSSSANCDTPLQPIAPYMRAVLLEELLSLLAQILQSAGGEKSVPFVRFVEDMRGPQAVMRLFLDLGDRLGAYTDAHSTIENAPGFVDMSNLLYPLPGDRRCIDKILAILSRMEFVLFFAIGSLTPDRVQEIDSWGKGMLGSFVTRIGGIATVLLQMPWMLRDLKPRLEMVVSDTLAILHDFVKNRGGLSPELRKIRINMLESMLRIVGNAPGPLGAGYELGLDDRIAYSWIMCNLSPHSETLMTMINRPALVKTLADTLIDASSSDPMGIHDVVRPIEVLLELLVSKIPTALAAGNCLTGKDNMQLLVDSILAIICRILGPAQLRVKDGVLTEVDRIVKTLGTLGDLLGVDGEEFHPIAIRRAIEKISGLKKQMSLE